MHVCADDTYTPKLPYHRAFLLCFNYTYFKSIFIITEIVAAMDNLPMSFSRTFNFSGCMLPCVPVMR